MKTFQWTLPEPSRSTAERREAAAYGKGSPIDLSRSEIKFVQRWKDERTLGPKVFRRKILLQSCLGLSVITGTFLLLKLVGLIDPQATLMTSAFFITLIANAASSLPTWKKNEKRYKKLLEQAAKD